MQYTLEVYIDKCSISKQILYAISQYRLYINK